MIVLLDWLNVMCMFCLFDVIICSLLFIVSTCLLWQILCKNYNFFLRFYNQFAILLFGVYCLCPLRGMDDYGLLTEISCSYFLMKDNISAIS